MSVRPAFLRRIIREVTQLRTEPPEGIRIQVPEEDMLDITGIIEGPTGTPYEGGYFRVKFKFTEEFPAAPPKCWFASKIFHPNVSNTGEICVNTLKKDWQSTYGIGHILVTVKCLLIYPNPDSALDEEAGKLLQEDYESYCERARLITKVHATPKTRPPEFDTPSPTSGSSSTSSSSSSASTSASSTSLSTPSTTASTQSRSVSSTTTAASRKSSPAPPSSIDKEQSLDSKPPTCDIKSTEKELTKDTKLPPPKPLGPADANKVPTPSLSSASASAGSKSGGEQNASGAEAKGAAGVGGTTAASKAVKRAAVGGASASEKRKKALKRL